MTDQIKKTAAALEKNGMSVFYAETAEKARQTVERLLVEGATIGVGGSETLKETGILALISSGNYRFFNRYDPALSAEEKNQMLCRSLSADFFLCSSNAITENGELVNADGISNRCAAIMFGPKRVIIVAGANKIVPDVEAGIRRIRAIAAPKNARRLGCKTYCAEHGHCICETGEAGKGCSSEDRICCNYVISAKQRQQGRIQVVLCARPLGY